MLKCKEGMDPKRESNGIYCKLYFPPVVLRVEPRVLLAKHSAIQPALKPSCYRLHRGPYFVMPTCLK
jgi:hypothetical protein